MFLDSFVIDRRKLTPDEVLAALERLPWQLRPGAPALPLTRQMRVREWLRGGERFGLLTILTELSGEFWSDVVDMLNQHFGINVDESEWLRVIRPSSATLGDLCDLVASHAEVEEVPTVSLTGKACRAAGIFLALRSRLRLMHGMKVEPSMPLPNHPASAWKVNYALALITGGRSAKPVRVDPPVHVAQLLSGLPLIMIACFAFLLISIGWKMAQPGWGSTITLVAACCGLAVSLLTFIWLASKYDRYAWKGLRSYRDLVRDCD
ncbi:MAG: hypothetical protein U0796_15715 [Gemmatales bacterium]